MGFTAKPKLPIACASVCVSVLLSAIFVEPSYLPTHQNSQSRYLMPTVYCFTGSWIQTKGPCRYSDGSFDRVASREVTSHGACLDFCIKNSECDAFDTDGNECVLFHDKDCKKHTGTGEGSDFCYVRDSGSSATPAPTCGMHVCKYVCVYLCMCTRIHVCMYCIHCVYL